MTDRRRIALVSARPISANDPFNGFTPRYMDLLEVLGESGDLLVVYLEIDPDQFRDQLAPADRLAKVVEVAVPAVGGSRIDRLSRSTRQLILPPGPERWEVEVERHLRDWKPDVVVTIAHNFGAPPRSATGSFPVVAFIEEDDTRDPERSRGLKSRFLSQLEVIGRRRSTPPPAVAVIISGKERPWAHRRFPRSQVVVVPHRIDTDYWAEPVDPSPDVNAEDVLVVGHMGHRRNADGLHDVARALLAVRDRPPGLRISVISSTAPHPVLETLPPDLIRFLGAVEDPRPYYRAAGQALVPSFIVPGVKTTILQAWATGCPVVTTNAAAASIGASDGIDVLSGSTPAEVAEATVRAAGDPGLRDRLRRAGRERLERAHGRDAVRASLDEAISLAMARGPAPASLTGDLKRLASSARKR